MQTASRLLVVLLFLTATWAVAAPAEAATSLRQCVGSSAAPLQARCTLAVGSGHLGVVGTGFKHAPCAKAGAVTAVAQPCYVGTMVMDLTWAGGSWRKTCSQVIHPGGTTEDRCTKSGTLPPAGKSFALICQSNHYSKDNPPKVLLPGGTGPFGCWVTLAT